MLSRLLPNRFTSWIRSHPLISGVLLCLAVLWGGFNAAVTVNDAISEGPLIENVQEQREGATAMVVSTLPWLRAGSYAAIFLVGVGGLVTVIFLVRTDPSKRPPDPALVTVVQGLERLREVYRTSGATAANSVVGLLYTLKENLAGQNTFAALLEFPAEGVVQGRARMAKALEGDSLTEARRALLFFMDNYWKGVRWLHNAEDEGFALHEPPYADRYAVWEERHGEMQAALRDLVQRAAFVGMESKLADFVVLGSFRRVKTQRSVVRRRLDQLDDDEAQFLQLFTLHTNPFPDYTDATREEVEVDKLLPYKIFSAGSRLARDGVLLESETGRRVLAKYAPAYGWTHKTFRLSHVAESELRETGLLNVRRSVVQISYRSVTPSQASGSGAPPRGLTR